MDNKLYRLMNWPEIEEVVYSECQNPERILGSKKVSGGHLVQCFIPGAQNVKIHSFSNEKEYDMTLVDEEGFYACLVPLKTDFAYEYIVLRANGETEKVPEVYNYIPKFWLNLAEKLENGIFYDSYRYFGAHFVERKGVLGTEFMVYAPDAERVSVVGDFNNWDGRVHQMSKIHDAGVFGIFLPGVITGALYKYEIKISNGMTFLKRDPFAFSIEKGRGDACRIIEDPVWESVKYKRKSFDNKFSLISISLKQFLKEFGTEEVGKKLIQFAKDFGITGYLFNDLGFCDDKDVTPHGKVSPFSVCPDVLRLKEIVKVFDELHDSEIKVFVTIDAGTFLADNGGLRGFDGTRLYEGDNDLEINQTLAYDFNKKYIRNYVISLCDYFIKVLSLDGLCLGDVDRILYLDYGKAEGQWRPNIYGGNENLNGLEFIKHLNSILHKKYPNIVTVAKDSLVSNNLTLPLEENGLGFDYKLHTQFDKDLLSYMDNDPQNRKNHHSELTYSPVYIYCEKFILSFLNGAYGMDEKKIIDRMPGNMEEKKANFRLALSYLYMHPGRKCIPFLNVSDETKELIKKLVSMYKEYEAISSDDDSPESFKWVNAIDSSNSVISFTRKCKNSELLVIANFSSNELRYDVGVDKGTYKEIFSSSGVKFGGEIKLAGRPKATKAGKADGKKNILSVNLPALCLNVYEKSTCLNNE